MAGNPGLRKDFTIKCPHCGWLPPQHAEYRCHHCSHPFDPFINPVECTACKNELKIYCDTTHGCGRSFNVEEWIPELPAIAGVMLDELSQLSGEEYRERKILESYFQYSDYEFISQIPFETPPFKLGNADCALPFSTFSTKELIDLFNTQAGIKTLNKTECRRMFLLLQELVSRRLDFNFFKYYDDVNNLHKIIMSDKIELWGSKVMLTYEGRCKYM